MTLPDPSPLRLPEALDYAAAPQLAERLRERRGAALSLDAGELRTIGASCAQILLAAARTWRADGRSLALIDLGEEPARQLALMGIDSTMLTVD